MKPAMLPRPGMMQKPQHMVYSGSSVASQPASLTHRSGAWQSTLSGEDVRDGGRGLARQLVIPRAKVKPRSNYQDYSDDDRLSAEVSVIILYTIVKGLLKTFILRPIVPCQSTIPWGAVIDVKACPPSLPKCLGLAAGPADPAAAHEQAPLTRFWMGRCPTEQIRVRSIFPSPGETSTGKMTKIT